MCLDPGRCDRLIFAWIYLDSDFLQNRMTFMADQIFAGFFLCRIFFCMYFKVFCRLRLIGLQKYILQKKYCRKKLVYS